MSNNYTERELEVAIENATGLKLGMGYGFINGTRTPYISAEPELRSASMIDGYILWKVNKDGTVDQKIITPAEHSLNTILKFLKHGN